MATLPMQHPDAAIAELERVVKEYGFKAVELGTAIGNDELAEPKFRPVLRRVQELKVVLFAHPNTRVPPQTGLLLSDQSDRQSARHHRHGGQAHVQRRARRAARTQNTAGAWRRFLPYQIGRFEHGSKVRPDTRAVTRTSPSRCSNGSTSMRSRTARRRSGI